jgi:hypothetical protein
MTTPANPVPRPGPPALPRRLAGGAGDPDRLLKGGRRVRPRSPQSWASRPLRTHRSHRRWVRVRAAGIDSPRGIGRQHVQNGDR